MILTIFRDVEGQRDSGNGFTDHVICLKRGDKGFGFKIVGGQEENTQVRNVFLITGKHPYAFRQSFEKKLVEVVNS